MREDIFSIRIQQGAINDIHNGYNWYQDQKDGLGDEFAQQVQFCFGKISEHPRYYSVFAKKFRRVRVPRFPYVIIYEIKPFEVVIIAIRHTSQNFKGRFKA